MWKGLYWCGNKCGNKAHSYLSWINLFSSTEKQIIQKFMLDGAVTQVRLEVIRRICLHRNMMGCQLHACFCFNRTIRTMFLINNSYIQHISITMIKLARVENKMFYLVISCHGKQHKFTAVDPTCVAAPPIQLVLTEPHSNSYRIYAS